MISAVDTVEWGTGEQSGERPGRLRTASLAVTGRGAAAALGVLGFAVLIAAELLPWGRLNLTAPDTGGFGQRGGPDPDTLSRLSSIGLDRLDIGSTLTYRIGSLVLLAVVGATIFGRPAQRRAAFGMGLGVLAAQILIVVSMVHSLNSVDPLGATGLGALALGGDLTQASSSVESGTFCAFAALALLLATLLLAAVPEQVRPRLVGGTVEPGGAPAADEPMELTVAPVAPLDESYFSRPDGYAR